MTTRIESESARAERQLPPEAVVQIDQNAPNLPAANGQKWPQRTRYWLEELASVPYTEDQDGDD